MKHTAPQKTAGRRYTGLLSRFIWLFGALFVLVMLTSTLFSVYSFQNTLVTTVEELEAERLKIQTRDVESLLHRYSTKAYEMAVDDQLRILTKTIAGGSAEATTVRDLRTCLSDMIMSDAAYVAATLALSADEFYIVTRLHDSTVWESWFSALKDESHDQALSDLCQRAEKAGGLVVGTMPDRRQRSPVRFFHLACPVFDLLTKEQYATVILTVSNAELAEVMNPDPDGAKITQGMLTAADGRVLCHAKPELIGVNMAENPDVGEGKLLWSTTAKPLNFQVYRVADERLLLSRARRNYVWQTVTLLLLLTVGFAITGWLMHRMTRSTRRLLQGIRQLGEGQQNVHVEVTDRHEIGQLSNAFNRLSDQLAQARIREQLQARQTLDALNRQHRAEMQALERQINAHFLYNTLNTINYTAIEDGSAGVSQQIRFLASILRYSFENSHEVVTTSQVMSWLDHYLTLQKLRFGNSFDYMGFADEKVKDWTIRKLLIQPFVENAVLHGFAGKRFGCILLVQFKPFGKERMRVTITDNGHGMPAPMVQELNRFFRNEQERLSWSDGVGLTNAKQRLLLYYHGQAKVFFRSQENTQTVVTLLLPRYKEEPELTQAGSVPLSDNSREKGR